MIFVQTAVSLRTQKTKRVFAHLSRRNRQHDRALLPRTGAGLGRRPAPLRRTQRRVLSVDVKPAAPIRREDVVDIDATLRPADVDRD